MTPFFFGWWGPDREIFEAAEGDGAHLVPGSHMETGSLGHFPTRYGFKGVSQHGYSSYVETLVHLHIDHLTNKTTFFLRLQPLFLPFWDGTSAGDVGPWLPNHWAHLRGETLWPRDRRADGWLAMLGDLKSGSNGGQPQGENDRDLIEQLGKQITIIYPITMIFPKDSWQILLGKC